MPQLPTSEDLKSSGLPLAVSPDFVRLRWYLREPLTRAIAVLDSPLDALSPQKPYLAISPSGTPSKHPVSSRPATDPPVSRLRVTLAPLDRYADDWDDVHYGHDDEDNNDHHDDENDSNNAREGGENISNNLNENSREAPHIQLTDETVVPPRRRRRCYREERPGPGPYLDVFPRGGDHQKEQELEGGNPSHLPDNDNEASPTATFVTVGDIVETVHPWMMELEGRIRAAKGVAMGWGIDGDPLPGDSSEDFDMYVYPIRADQIIISDTRGAGPGWTEGMWKQLAGSTRKRLEMLGGGGEWGGGVLPG